MLSCQIPGCGFRTDNIVVIGAAAILNVLSHTNTNPHHVLTHHTPTVPTLICSKIQRNSTWENWNDFFRRWNTFRIGSGITTSSQPLECTTKKLRNIVLHGHPSFTSKTLKDALAVLKSIVVIPVALSVLQSDLAATRQDSYEPFCTFAECVQDKAETCELKTNFIGHCSNCHRAATGEDCHMDGVIRDVLLNGTPDLDVHCEALSTEAIRTQPITETIAFVVTEETAHNANPTLAVSTLSEYQQSNQDCLIQHK